MTSPEERHKDRRTVPSDHPLAGNERPPLSNSGHGGSPAGTISLWQGLSAEALRGRVASSCSLCPRLCPFC